MLHKKLQLLSLLFLSVFSLSAQKASTVNGCGNDAPPQQWEEWMSAQTEQYKKNIMQGKSQAHSTIPVVVHVIYFNETVGTYPNIDSNQIKSQIKILNRDFAGNGLNSNQVPSYFAPFKANTGIEFCLARKDPADVLLLERGTHRVSASANSWLSPATPTLDVKAYFNSVIIPATIWDPTKYLNIWISDKPTTYTLNGFATYPPSTSLPGLFGNSFGTTGNDGIWIWTKAFGDTVTVQPPYDKGRNCTHEVGHWLGLRHTWGDGNCLSDYCGDTPTSKNPHYGCMTSTAPDLCGINLSPNGEMPMNFMDRSDDACMYMFTQDQNARMNAALSQSSLRYQLGTHGKCDAPIPASTSSAMAAFNTPTAACLNGTITPFNNSSGYPYPTFVWSTSPAASILPNTSVNNPAITFNNPGYYTLTLVATNSISSSTHSQVIYAQGTCQPLPLCIDSLRMIKITDTLNTYEAPISSITGCQSGWTGYLTGTNCYKDKEFAQFYPPSTYTSVSQPQVNSVMVLFDSLGTVAFNSQAAVNCKIYGGNSMQGPQGAIGSVAETLGNIVNTQPKPLTVSYLGKSGVPPKGNTKIIPHRFDFAIPVLINANTGFFASIQAPNSNPFDSINIFTNTRYNNAIDSSAWYLNSSSNWRTYKYNRGMKIQLAIMPLVTCSPVVGLKENMVDLRNNVMLMPNPNSGLFNLIFTLPKEQALRLKVYNSLGQTVNESQLSHVLNNVISVDLSTEPDGIYFAEISNGMEKTVKKVIVTH